MAVNKAKQRMLEGKPAIGAEVGLGSPLSAELISPLGFDYVLVDNQHGLPGRTRARCMPSGPSASAYGRAHGKGAEERLRTHRPAPGTWDAWE